MEEIRNEFEARNGEIEKFITGSQFYERSVSIAKLSVPLPSMLAEISNVQNTKDGYGYKYAPLSEILEKVRPVLEKHGFGLTQLVSTSDTNTIAVKTILMHISGEYLSSTMELPPTDVKGTVQIQKMGASISYARRYMATAILGIAGEEDTDGVPPGKVQPKGKAQPKVPEQKPKDVKAKLESAVKMINALMKDNEGKFTDEQLDQLDRDYNDIRNMNDTVEKYQKYRDFYSQIQKTIKDNANAKDV